MTWRRVWMVALVSCWAACRDAAPEAPPTGATEGTTGDAPPAVVSDDVEPADGAEPPATELAPGPPPAEPSAPPTFGVRVSIPAPSTPLADARARCREGHAHLSAERWDEASAALTTAIESILEHDDPEAFRLLGTCLYNLALVREHLNDPHGARALLTWSMEVRPNAIVRERVGDVPPASRGIQARRARVRRALRAYCSDASRGCELPFERPRFIGRSRCGPPGHWYVLDVHDEDQAHIMLVGFFPVEGDPTIGEVWRNVYQMEVRNIDGETRRFDEGRCGVVIDHFAYFTRGSIHEGASEVETNDTYVLWRTPTECAAAP